MLTSKSPVPKGVRPQPVPAETVPTTRFVSGILQRRGFVTWSSGGTPFSARYPKVDMETHAPPSDSARPVKKALA